MTRHSITYPGPFGFEAGGSVSPLEIVFHCSDRPYTPSERVIWICHALTANSDPSDWWEGMVGEGRPLDPEKYFLVCVNMIGSPYGTTGPASVNPSTGRPYMLDFPRVSVRDMARTMIEVRKYLGISHVDLLLGSSIGGFQALEWAVMEPEVIRRAAFIATAARVSPYLSAFEESQRMAIEADPSYREARDLRGGDAGMRCARSIALISYRTHDCYCATQAEPDQDALFAARAASYQRYQGKKLSDRFDAYSYMSLTDSVDSHNLGRGRGGVQSALSRIKAESTVVAIDSDVIFPPSEMRLIADGIPGAVFKQIHSVYGHDGFLLEYKQLTDILSPIICKF